MKEIMSIQECDKIETGAALTLTAVMAICAISIVAVVVYKMFLSSNGSANIPGGWKFTWK